MISVENEEEKIMEYIQYEITEQNSHDIQQYSQQ